MTQRFRNGPAALTAGLVLVLGLAACGSAAPYAAKVDGTTITSEDLESEMRAIAANQAYLTSIENRIQIRGTGQGTFDAAFTGQVLGRQIQYVLVDREIDRRKLKIGDSQRQAARSEVAQQAGGEEILGGFPKEYQDQLVERAARVSALTVALAGQDSGDAAAKAYYDSHKEEFTHACVSHILVGTKEKADELKGRLAGGEDFGAVAKAESRDSLSASQNGSLGCDISSDTIDSPQFVSAVMRQPLNEVGDAVQTSAGWHLIKVTSRTIPPFERVSSQAQERVVLANKAKLQQWIEGAVKEAEIEVNPKYGRFDKENLTVVPPEAPTTVTSTPPQSGIQPLRP